MRIALIGAAASALLGGTLAVTPLTSVSTPLSAGAACSGAKCERLAAVLLPDTPQPGPDAASAQPGAASAAPAASLGQSGAPVAASAASSGSSSPASFISPASSGSSGGAPGAALPGLPPLDASVLGGLPDAGMLGIPNPETLVPGLAGLVALPAGANAANAVVASVLGAGTGLVGLFSYGASSVTSLAVTYALLQQDGIIPKNGVGGIGLPSLSGVGLTGLSGVGGPLVTTLGVLALSSLGVPVASTVGVLALTNAGVPAGVAAAAVPAVSGLAGGAGLEPVALAAAALPALGRSRRFSGTCPGKW
jgi:hypothetical protein